jgi:hypothetical protein
MLLHSSLGLFASLKESVPQTENPEIQVCPKRSRIVETFSNSYWSSVFTRYEMTYNELCPLALRFDCGLKWIHLKADKLPKDMHVKANIAET